ncbi:uncharacterized protein UTRI_02362 [Ustilago trichophora]|uniref:Uncharacterized protein n=1 Tax=Ustilago trichophora TaxID=86804 RepID=A0A5C3E6K8_9BASI|nr:uncharacterized protein UTRI_02362 [Ustilago trichophora]
MGSTILGGAALAGGAAFAGTAGNIAAHRLFDDRRRAGRRAVVVVVKAGREAEEVVVEAEALTPRRSQNTPARRWHSHVGRCSLADSRDRSTVQSSVPPQYTPQYPPQGSGGFVFPGQK